MSRKEEGHAATAILLRLTADETAASSQSVITSSGRRAMFRLWSPPPAVLLSQSTEPIDSLTDEILWQILLFIHVKQRVQLLRVCKRWQNIIRTMCRSQRVIGFEKSAIKFTCRHSFRLTEVNVLNKKTSAVIMTSPELEQQFQTLFPNLMLISAPERSLSSHFIAGYTNSLTCLSVSGITGPHVILPGLTCLSFVGFRNLWFPDYPALTSVSTVSEMDDQINSLPAGLTHLSCQLKFVFPLSAAPFTDSLTHLYIKTSVHYWDPNRGILGLGVRHPALSFPVLRSLLIAEDSSDIRSDFNQFFRMPPIRILNSALISLPRLESLGLRVMFLDDECMVALRDLLTRLPNLTALCLSGLYRGLVQEVLLTVADTQCKRLHTLFVEPLLLDAEAISSLSRLTRLRVYGTRIVTYKSKDKRIGAEIAEFFRSDVVRQLTDISFRIDRPQDASLLDHRVKRTVSDLKRTGKLQHCRSGTGDIVDSFISEIHRIGL